MSHTCRWVTRPDTDLWTCRDVVDQSVPVLLASQSQRSVLNVEQSLTLTDLSETSLRHVSDKSVGADGGW